MHNILVSDYGLRLVCYQILEVKATYCLKRGGTKGTSTLYHQPRISHPPSARTRAVQLHGKVGEGVSTRLNRPAGGEKRTGFIAIKIKDAIADSDVAAAWVKGRTFDGKVFSDAETLIISDCITAFEDSARRVEVAINIHGWSWP
jgi:hypothetical protein